MKKTPIFAVILLTLASCSDSKGVLSTFPTCEKALNYQSLAFQNTSTKFDVDRFEAVKGHLLDAMEERNISKLDRYLGELYYYVYQLCDKKEIANTRYYATVSSSYKERFDELNNLYLEFWEFYENLERLAYESKNQEIINLFFEGQTNEEIEEYLFETEKSEKLNDLYLQMSDIQDRINVESSNRPDAETYFNDGIDALYEYAPLCDEYASVAGYDNYLEYLQKESYGRSYDLEDAINLCKNLKETYSKDFAPFDLSSCSTEEKQKLQKAVSGSMFAVENNFAPILDDYSSLIGKEYYDLYQHLFTDGYYCFSDNDNALGTAYSAYLLFADQPLVFFGPDYQNIFTVAHELGHSFASLIVENDYASYDICETHSQTNELLICSYLSSLDDTFYKKLSDYYVNYFVNYLFRFASTVEIEYFALTNYKNMDKETMKTKIKEIVASYNGTTSDTYWVATTICDTGYYISYLTSGIAALNMYDNAKINFEDAKTNYLKFVTEFDEETGEVEQWKRYGFGSPFDESSLQKIEYLIRK